MCRFRPSVTIGDHRQNLGRSAMASGAPLLAPNEPNEPNSSDDVVFWELLSSHFITRRPKFLEGRWDTHHLREAISNGDFMVMLQGKSIWDNQFASWEEWIYGCIQKGTPARVEWDGSVFFLMSVRFTKKSIWLMHVLIIFDPYPDLKTLVVTQPVWKKLNWWMDDHKLFFLGPPLWSRVFFFSIHDSPWVKSQHISWGIHPKPQLGKGWVGETRLNSDSKSTNHFIPC